MSDHAHPAFVETVRCMLVNPRRNVQRALDRLRGTKHDYVREVMELLYSANEQLVDLEARVHAEENRTVHTCSCGHTHYVHGDEA